VGPIEIVSFLRFLNGLTDKSVSETVSLGGASTFPVACIAAVNITAFSKVQILQEIHISAMFIASSSPSE